MENAAESRRPTGEALHEPVMGDEVVALLGASRPLRIVDATVGTGGHAELLLQSAPAAACLLGLDRDPEVLKVAASRLGRFGARAILRKADFADLDKEAAQAGFDQVDAIIADLGMSSFALDDAGRGFSFLRDGPLDMRFDPGASLTAERLVNDASESQLTRLIYEYGEERASRRIARAIVNARRGGPITTTSGLRAVIDRAVGRRGSIHPATRTFQALRIAVNHELESLQRLLEKAPLSLAPGGRMAALAYHSLEDRPVKERFKELAAGDRFALVTRKPLRPSPSEVARNPRARSARLRCLEAAR